MSERRGEVLRRDHAATREYVVKHHLERPRLQQTGSRVAERGQQRHSKVLPIGPQKAPQPDYGHHRDLKLRLALARMEPYISLCATARSDPQRARWPAQRPRGETG